eukprot:4131194-Alexandrium_andersonii.AAC.1
MMDKFDLKVSPVVFKMKKNVVMRNIVGFLKTFERCATNIHSDISVHENSSTSISFDFLNSALNNLTPVQVETLRGRALAQRPDR